MFRILSAALALAGLAGSLAAKPNIAVLELTGNGINPADLAALTNRLRSDLVQTDSFTVLERGAMDEILKEQGFQQSGCTDAACAVEAGKLLNVEYMVSGSVDRVGSVYSVNVRMINVQNGDLRKNVTADCDQCPLETVFKQSIKQAACRLAGMPEPRIDQGPSSPAKKTAVAVEGRRTVPYKGKRTGPGGTAYIRVSPDSAEVVIEGSSYGSRSVQITGLPEGNYTVTVKCKNWATQSKDIKVWRDEIAETDLVLKRPTYFRAGLGYAINSMNLHPSYVFVFPLNSGGSVSGTYKVEEQPVEAWVRLGWRNLYNYFGMRVNFLPGFVLGQVTFTARDTGGVSGEIRMDVRHFNLGVFADYSRIFTLLRGCLSIEPGISAGFGGQKFTYFTSEHSWIADTPDCFASFFNFGGPRMAVNFGFPRVKLSAEYQFVLWMLEDTSNSQSLDRSWTMEAETVLGFGHRLLFSLFFDI